MAANHHQEIDALNQFAADTIHQAGREAMTYYGKGKSGLKFDEDLVTEAELHLQTYFQDQILAHFPDHQLFVNNPVDMAYSHEGKRYLWVFDPIDGADNFQTGVPIWGMSVALLENFWPILGTFYMPATGDLFQAMPGRNAYRGTEKIAVSQFETVDDESLFLVYSRWHQKYHSRFPGKIRNLGCTAAHICYVAMGRADAAVIANESFQDLAAARVIIEAAGGKFFKLDGTECFLHDYLDGNKIDEPLLVTAPEKFSAVRECLDRIE